MKVGQLANMLKPLPQDADVYLDDEYYPSVIGVHSSDGFIGDIDKEDEPPPNAVLIEFIHSDK